MTDAIAEFRDAMRRAGIEHSGQIIGDGRIHQITFTRGASKKRAGYRLYLDERPAGTWWDYSVSEQGVNWKAASDGRRMTDAERAELVARSEAKKAEAAIKEARDQADAAKRARRVWDAATPCVDHPYLTRKQVASYGLRTGAWWRYVNGNTVPIPDALIIPMYAGAHRLASLQAIFPSADNPLGRDRDFLTHGRKQGCYFRIGRPDGRVYICEGYATGATVHAETGSCVVVAMTAGNLTAVAQMVRAKLPAIEIIIAADNDAWTVVAGRPDNPGMRHATAAAAAVSGRVVAPEFPDHAPGKPTDWNDLYHIAGPGSVRDQIDRQIGR